MNQIAFTKNGLPLVIYTQFVILFVVCMPLCSTGIVKREIQPSNNATKLILQPSIKLANNTSANVTATTKTSSSTTTRPIEVTTTPRILTTTTEKLTTQAPQATTEKDAELISKDNVTVAPVIVIENGQGTTEKYAELISKDNGQSLGKIVVTEALESATSQVIDSQPVTDKNNFDDDAEAITFGDADGVTTEEQRFDLSRYTSDYNGNDNEHMDYNETHQQLINENDSDRDEPLSTYNIGYEHNLRDMVLTTPESPFFDEKHKEYENDKSYERYQDENTAPVTDSEPIGHRYNSDKFLNDIHGNSTEEHKKSTYLNKADVESMNYDISASEVKDNTANSTGTGEKKAKFMQEGSHVNLTVPDAGEVWALASMKKIEHTKNSQGQFYNVTTLDKEPDKNGTLVTKQLADWAEVTKNNDYKNSTYTTKDGNNNTSEETEDDYDEPITSDTTNHISNTTSDEKIHLDNLIEALKNFSLNLNSSNNIPRRRNNLANNVSSNNSRRRFNSTYNIGNDASPVKSQSNLTDILKNINLTMSRLTNNNMNRGRLKFQQKPLIISDQDSASQENQIIAVKMTTHPPPIAVTKKYTQATQTSMPVFPEVRDSENKINIQQMGVTDMVSENDGTDTTTKEIETTQNIDNSQNELKNRFTTLRPRATQIEDETTTDMSFEVTTEDEQTTFSFNVDEIPTTTQVYETTTLRSNFESKDNNVRTTTEKEFPTTNRVNLETDSVTEEDDDDDDEQSSITTANRLHTTEKEILDSQSSTLQPRYVEFEKTTEMRNPTTEFTRTTTDNVQPTTEFITKKENKVNDRLPDSENKEELTTNIINLNRDEYRYGTIKSNLFDTSTQGLHTADAIPEVIDDITHSQEHTPTTDGQIPDIGGFSLDEPPDTNAIIAISVSVVGVVVVGVIVGVLFIMRKRQKQLTYGQRCRPVGLDAYSLDNVSVYNSVRRKGVLRMSKRSYGNAAFDDPSLKNNLLSTTSLAAFAQKKNEIYEEFKELPTVTARAEEVPPGCEDKNRYANIIPLPESRVFLKRIGDDEKTEYINANFVKGPKDNSHYYIACQGPLESTVIDFWRMIWEQNSRVIIMATDIIESGIEQCAEYLPPSFVIDNHVTFGDFNITLKNREVKEKYAMSMVHLMNTNTNTWREVTHFWYQWPDTGVPTEQSSLIELLLEARGFLKVSTAEQMDDNENSQNNNGNLNVGNGGVDKSKSLLRSQGPLTVHCSPGTGRTGTIIACDIALRALELPTKSVDIPQIVYFVRRGRASAVRTREQYEFIYKVANVYAAKLTGPTTEN